MTGRPETQARKAFFEQARALTPYVATEYEGAVFVVPTATDERFFVNRRRKDLRLLRQAIATVREHGCPAGTTFVDVGAHIGTSTISALAHHGFERAVSIEPDRDNLRLLRANLALNGLEERATVVPAAVSEFPGSAYFAPVETLRITNIKKHVSNSSRTNAWVAEPKGNVAPNVA